MRKKKTAIFLAAMIMLLSNQQLHAEDIMLEEMITETDLDVIDDWELADVQEDQMVQNGENGTEDWLISVETVENGTSGTETELLTDELEGVVSQSGDSQEAVQTQIRLYALSYYEGCYGNQLQDTAREVYDAMVKRYVQDRQSGEVEIVLDTPITFQTSGTPNGSGGLLWNSESNAEYQQKVSYAMQAAYDAFVYDHPEVFWMNKFRYSVRISFSGSSGFYTGTVKTLKLVPIELYAGASGEAVQFETAVDEVCSELGVDSNDSKFRIIRAIHDCLCRTTSYGDADNSCAHSAAGIFLKKDKVVCEGYAKAFKILCERYGIECVLIVGNAKESHMWNYVRMEDGNWYLVDVTWDDQNTGIKNTYFLAGSQTIGFDGIPIADERTVYTNFSGAEYTHTFSIPILSVNAYQEEQAEHEHIWQIVEEKEPTCQEEGYCIYKCSECQDESRLCLGTVPHRFTGICYRDNDDATCTSDGTRTICCDFGCGEPNGSITVNGSALDHSFVNYRSNQDANFHKDGTKTAVCEHGCGAQKTITDTGTKVKLQTASVTLQKNQKLAALQVTGLPSGVTVKSWKSSNTKIVKVSKKGVITAGNKTGTAKITVTIGNGVWTDQKDIAIKVQEKAVKTTKITVDQKSVTLQKGKKHQIKATITPISGQKVTYTSSNKKIASVSAQGIVTAKGAGTATITVKSGNKKCSVKIKVPKTKTTKLLNIPKATITLKKGKTKKLNIKVYPSSSDEKISYTSSNKKKVSVSAGGKITAKKIGTVTITIKSGSVKENIKVKVKK